MTYNADNRRVIKESTTLETKFVWEPISDNVLLETNDFNTTQAVYTQEPEEFGSLISQRRGSATNWFCFDALGSTWNLTNSSETITDSYIYDAWGNRLSSTGTTVNPFQYIGQYGYYFDEETGAHVVRRRIYQPTIARWWSVDPLGFVDGLNKYLYVKSSPAFRIDPSGLASIPKDCKCASKAAPAKKGKLCARYFTEPTGNWTLEKALVTNTSLGVRSGPRAATITQVTCAFRREWAACYKCHRDCFGKKIPTGRWQKLSPLYEIIIEAETVTDIKTEIVITQTASYSPKWWQGIQAIMDQLFDVKIPPIVEIGYIIVPKEVQKKMDGICKGLIKSIGNGLKPDKHERPAPPDYYKCKK